jgi:hypothetical protein
MGLNVNASTLAVNAVAAAGTYISAHTADPGTGGASEVAGGSYARQQTTWAAASAGARVGSQVTIPIPAGTTVTHWGVWSAASAGTFYGFFDMADEVFGSGGNLLVTPTLAY